MKSFTATIGAALLATGVFAQQAVVKNNCQSTVYVQSFPYDGSAPGPLTTLKRGQSFSEDLRPVGSVSLPSLRDCGKKASLTGRIDGQDRQNQDLG